MEMPAPSYHVRPFTIYDAASRSLAEASTMLMELPAFRSMAKCLYFYKLKNKKKAGRQERKKEEGKEIKERRGKKKTDQMAVEAE